MVETNHQKSNTKNTRNHLQVERMKIGGTKNAANIKFSSRFVQIRRNSHLKKLQRKISYHS